MSIVGPIRAALIAPVFMAGLLVPAMAQDTEPLPSWNAGDTKQAILDFVASATDETGPNYVAPADRIAVFDNDGTLWTEHPMYTQLAFALDRVKALAPQHPEWKTTEPFKSVLAGDMKGLEKSGKKGVVELIAATHTGMSTADFEQIVADWFKTAKHPRFDRPYTELAYQPMLEVLDYLRDNDFKTYIVSGGGIEFMRVITEDVYGIPPEQVVGSSVKTKFEIIDGEPQLTRLAELAFDDDKDGKPVGINAFIGKRPVAAFGNSDGDRQMLEWTAAGPAATLMMLVHHDDGTREYAYGPAGGLPDSPFGHMSQSTLDEADASDWTVISMKNDWSTIFPSAAK
ncbi:haloacid dehalogenase-like hydrolase [Martelella lutilitoris]|uniref:Haloacid dehalogenase-like hydrolase n=1 Tax=Martelella lutilitoris TaxID=2583532 RepID=A0A5C4JUB9_9HYPH|nr:haloacid dehalogenase-like hydrolase [Martelella lutilitoris]